MAPEAHRDRLHSCLMNAKRSNRGAGGRRASWRRATAALGAAVAIAVGGIGMVGQQEAQAAGVSQPLIVQSSPIVVSTAQAPSERHD